MFKFQLLLLCITLSMQVNFVVNGGFSNPNISLSLGRLQAPLGIVGWTGSIVEIGLGSWYNSQWWANLPVLSLDTGVNQIVSQTIELPYSSIFVLSFLWAGHEGFSESSSGTVTFSGITKFLNPKDDSLHEQSLFIPGLVGNNQLVFSATGKADGLGIGVSQISLSPASLVINGNFAFPDLGASTIKNYPNSILGWTGTLISIGNGNSLNQNWGDGLQVMQTVANKVNQQVSQQFTNLVPSAQYKLSFLWACHSVAPNEIYASQKMTVSWNNVVIESYSGIDGGVSYSSKIVTAKGLNDSLSFTGTVAYGIESGIGVANVRLVLK